MTRVKRFAVALTLLLLSDALAPLACGAELIREQERVNDNPVPQECRADYACAQVFTAGVTGVVERVSLPLARSGDTAALRIEVRAVSGNALGDEVLAEAVVPAAEVPPYKAGTVPQWTTVELEPRAGGWLTVNQPYALVVTSAGETRPGKPTTFYWFDVDDPNAAPGYQLLQHQPGAWKAYDSDFAFRIEMAKRNLPPAIVAPATATVAEDGSVQVPLEIRDEDPAGVKVTAFSGDTTIVAQSGLRVEGAGAKRVLTITPAPDQHGTVTVTVTATDAGNLYTNATIAVTVTPVNDPPVVKSAPAQIETAENAPVTVPVQIGEPKVGMQAVDDPLTVRVVDRDGDDLTVTASTNAPELLSVAVTGSGASRTLTITPVKGKSGKANVTLTVSDGTTSVTHSFPVTVLSTNEPPQISGLRDLTIDEDETLTFVFTVSDDETDPGELQVAVTAENQAQWFDKEPTITKDAGKVSVSWTPRQDVYGKTQVFVTVTDAEGGTATGSFTLTIRPRNDPPVIIEAPAGDTETDEDTPFRFVVAADDPDPEDQLELYVFSSNTRLLPASGIEIVPDEQVRGRWTVTLTPAANEHGETQITLQVSDGSVTVKREFRLSVNIVDDPPVIDDIPDVFKELGVTQFDVIVRITDVDDMASGIRVTATPEDQNLLTVLVQNTGPDRWRLTITPRPGLEGTTSITVVAKDGSNEVSKSFNVVISAPLKIDLLPQEAVVDEDGTAVFHFNVTPADKIHALRVFSRDAVLLPDDRVTLTAVSPGYYRLELKPAPDKFGKVVVVVEAENPYHMVTTHYLTLTVNPVNDDPVLEGIPEKVRTEEDTPVSVPFYLYDPDPYDSHTFYIHSSNTQLVPSDPPYIVVEGSGTDRVLRIRPFKDANGSTVITVTVQDSGNKTATWIFELIVDPVDDPPVIRLPAAANMDEDTTAFFEIVVEDIDGPGGTKLEALANDATVIVVSEKHEGWVDTFTLQVTPNKDKSGPVQINLTAISGASEAASAVLIVNVREINDEPELTVYAQNVELNEDESAMVDLRVWDVETPLDRLLLSAASDNPTLLPPESFTFTGQGTNRELVITPAADQFGQAQVVITLSDGQASVNSKPISVTVHSVPDAPRIIGLGKEITMKEDGYFAREVEIYDPDSPMSEVEVSVSYALDPENPYLLAADSVRLEGSGAHRRLVVEPEPDEYGKATIIIETRSRDDQAQALLEIPLTVEPVNDPPVLSEFTESQRTILEDEALAGVSLTYFDVDSPASALKATITADNKQLLPDGSLSVVMKGFTEGDSDWYGTASIAANPAKDRYGTATITLTISDGYASASRSFRLIVTPVNDAPSFVKGPNQTVDEDAGPQKVVNWATAITPGPYEENQKVWFEVVTDNPDLFAEGPAVAPNGTLTYTPAPDAFGTAEVEVRLVDDGGTDYGGVNASPWQKFTINVRAVNDAPVIAPIPTMGTEIGQITDEIDITVTDVDSDVSQITLEVTSANPGLVPNDPEHIIVKPVAPGQWKLQLRPVEGKIGTATITVRATDAEGGTSLRPFDLIVNDLWLTGLAPSAGTMTPPFDRHVLSYSVVYSGWLPQVQVTATAQDPDVRIRVRRADDPQSNWVEAQSGKPSPPVTLSDGGGEVEVEVYSPATGIRKPYLLVFLRAKSTVAELVDLSISPGKLQPEFRPDRTSYTATVPYDVTEVTVNAQAGDAWSKVWVEGNQDLKVGLNRITVTVVAENGTSKVYTINLTREPGPMAISAVEVETGAEWATLRFETDDTAEATVYYRPDGGEEQSRSAGYGTRHSVTLTGLQPATRYTYRIQATRGSGSDAELVSAFRTEPPEAVGLCEEGEGGALACPATSAEKSLAQSVAPAGAQPDQVAAAVVTDLDMGAAVASLLAAEVPEAERTVVVRLDDQPYGVALLDAAALQRAAGAGATVTVSSRLGAVTLTPELVADLKLAADERLAVVLAEGQIDNRYLEVWTGVGGYRQVGEPLQVSLVRIAASGATTPIATLPSPLLLSYPVPVTDPVEAVTLAIFAQTDPTSQLQPLGGRLAPEGDRIEVAQTTTGVTVLLAYENRFEDVPPGHWAYAIVHEMAARQVLRGVSPTRFAPSQPITRGQLAAILTRALKLGQDDRFARVYYDISPYDPLAAEIGGAIRSGIMTGYPDGTFRPDVPVTRQELAVVLSRMADRLNLPGSLDRETGERLSRMADWDQVAPWAQDGVRFAVAEGLMKGRSDSTFAPLEQTTRAEAATVIKRLLDKVAPGEWR